MCAFNDSLRHGILVLIGLSTLGAYAQEDTTRRRPGDPPSTMEEVDVVRDYRPILADAVKIRQSPDLTNIRAYQPKLRYAIQDKRLDINTGTRQLSLQALAAQGASTLYNNYAKLGVGNFSTINGELYISNGADEYMHMGAFAKHLSQSGSLEGQSFSQQQLGIFGRSILENITLNGELGYKRNASNFYGFVPSMPTLNPSPDPLAYNDIYVKGELNSNFEDNEELLSYSVKADGYLFSNNYEASENAFALSANINKKVKAFNVGANVSGDFATVNDEAFNLQNHIGRLNPYIKFKGKNYSLTLGANFVSEFGGESQTNIFPAVNLELALIPDFTTIYAGINGDVKRTSLRSMAYENPFLNSNLNIQNMVEKFNAYGGIKGNGGAALGYKVGVFYKRVNDMPFFINTPPTISSPTDLLTVNYNYNRFDIIYDAGDNNVYGLEGEINFQVSEAFKLGGKVTFTEYDMATEEQAWFMPKFKAEGNTRINITDKVFVTGELQLMGQTYAKLYFIDQPYERVTIPAFADISAGIEYRITPRIGIYGQFNNLLGNDYERYLYYPRLGLNAIGGVNFSF